MKNFKIFKTILSRSRSGPSVQKWLLNLLKIQIENLENVISNFEKFFLQSKALPEEGTEAEIEIVEIETVASRPEETVQVVPKQEAIETGQDLPVVDLEFKIEAEASVTTGMF